MVNNSTNINKTNNHLSPKESLNSDGQQFSTNINKTNNHLSPKESLSSDGQQFYQYQQNQALILNHWKQKKDHNVIFEILVLACDRHQNIRVKQGNGMPAPLIIGSPITNIDHLQTRWRKYFIEIVRWKLPSNLFIL